MRHRTHVLLPLPEMVPLPTGNVHVLPKAEASADGVPSPRTTSENGKAGPTATGWVIHDGRGRAIKPSWPSRAEALRQMGAIGLRGDTWLPLTLHGPDGRPTGDRLA